jgi:Fe2+ transport system protein B
MELDLTYEPHLTSGQYHRMATGLPLELKLEAYRRELKFKNIGEYPAMRSNVYGKYLATLYDAGRFEEAISVLEEMKNDPEYMALYKGKEAERLLEMQNRVAKYQQKIKERDAAKSEKDNTQQTDDKQTQLKTTVDPTPVDPDVETSTSNRPDAKWLSDHLVGYLALIIVIIMALVFMAWRRKK